ncbi:hypothetical protein HPB51_027727 [Rhipicephalus microplus]|uniref:Tick transposon n=1 Tax=Rhipicephalus microplus TaxID=6941 RepID=A0A9J6CZJ5_RHIMP|nr:hypothetical protein HPB51_027727 [Rhipicephalus microplus]
MAALRNRAPGKPCTGKFRNTVAQRSTGPLLTFVSAAISPEQPDLPSPLDFTPSPCDCLQIVDLVASAWFSRPRAREWVTSLRLGRRGWVHVDAVPRNLHPECNKARRQTRTGATTKALARAPGVPPFVEAAQYPQGTRFVIVTTCIGDLHRASSVTTLSAETAEEVVIALATPDPTCDTIVCAYRSAVTNYSKGRISPQALRILCQAPHSKANMITLTRIPAHARPVMH